jgi:type II secretory pathway component GspD/PulD (secretin)
VKYRVLFSLFVVLVALGLSTPVLAENGSQKGPISLSLEGADLRTVLDLFAKMTSSQLDLDPGLEGKVTITVENISWMTALDAICEGVGCDWVLSGGSPRVLAFSPAEKTSGSGLYSTVSISAQDEPITDLVGRLASTAGFRLAIIGQPKGSVSLVMEGAKALTVLSAICESGQGCHYRIGEDVVQVVATDKPPTTLDQLEDMLDETMNLHLREANGLDVFRVFSQLTNLDIVIDPGINGTVTMELTDVSSTAALDEICRQVGCTWSIEVAEGIGATIRIKAAE